ncbi:MAG TPA: hypothetical protein ENF69_06130 [Euryarchaeota archaeon]|nr:hypothetical protein [Euryarchaeota archaeon]
MRERLTGVLIVMLGLMVFSPSFLFFPGEVQVEAAPGGETTRYGFTPNITWSVNPGFEVWALDTGNLDGGSGPDIAAGGLEKIQIYFNNGQGTSFTRGQTISLPTGEKIVRLEVADVDGDGDDDILAWGIFNDVYMDDATQVSQTPTTREFRFNYFENDGSGTFTLKDYITFNSVFVLVYHPYFQDGHWDMTAGDIDNDGDVDAVVVTGQTNSNNWVGSVNFTVLKYDNGSFHVAQTLKYTATRTDPWLWGLADLGDMNGDGYLDLLMVVEGYLSFSNGPALFPRVYVQNNTGSGTFVTSLNLVGIIQTSGSRLVCSYDISHGDFLGTGYTDILVTSNYDVSGNMISGMVWTLGGMANGGFTRTFQIYLEIYHWGPREISVGRLDNQTGDDFGLVFWYDGTLDPSPYDQINRWSATAVSSRPLSYPPAAVALRQMEPGRELPRQIYRTIEVDNMDRDTAGYDDVVLGGDNVTVVLTTYPPPKPPRVLRATHTPLPIHNDGNEIMTINITATDPDGWKDIDRATVDLNPIGDKLVTLQPTSSDPPSGEVYFEYKTTVAPEIPPGLYECNVTIYDKVGLQGEGKLYVRVEQYNRAPIISPSAPREIQLYEDTPIYVEGVYDFFEDPDGDQMLIYLKTESNLWGKSFANNLIAVTLVNGSDENPYPYSLHIQPVQDAHGTTRITLKATDGIRDSEELIINVTIISVNDLPKILGISSPGKFDILLQEGRPFYGRVLAEDPHDDNNIFSYYAEFLDDTEPLFRISEEGEIRWTPTNDDVGTHRVMIYVDDMEGGNVSALVWFNVTNENNAPRIVSISNGTYTYSNLAPGQVVEFTVYEHDFFNLTISVVDEDIEIGEQTAVIFTSDLSFYEGYRLIYDPEADPFTASITMKMENAFGIYCTYPPEYPPLTGNITVVDQDSSDKTFTVAIKVTVVNVNDPPGRVRIVTPPNGQVFKILFHRYFSASGVDDPDIPYNDSIRYVWDFDASDGFQEQAEGQSVYWDFLRAGNYTVTVRVYDSQGLYTEDSIYVVVNGVYNLSDYDGDGLPNEWEERYGLDIYNPDDALQDMDGDGLTNLQEFENGTDPFDRDTDDDGHPDGEDAFPTNGAKWKVEKPVKESPFKGLIIPIVVIIVIVVILGLFIEISLKKRREAEERRRAERERQLQMEREKQMEYSKLYGEGGAPPAPTEAEIAPEAPSTPRVPPPEAGEIDFKSPEEYKPKDLDEIFK